MKKCDSLEAAVTPSDVSTSRI